MYSPQLYAEELHDLIAKIDANPRIPNKHMLLGPSVGSSIPGVTWTPEQVWETGWIDTFKDRLSAITVEQYVQDFSIVSRLRLLNSRIAFSATPTTIAWRRLVVMVIPLLSSLKKR